MSGKKLNSNSKIFIACAAIILGVVIISALLPVKRMDAVNQDNTANKPIKEERKPTDKDQLVIPQAIPTDPEPEDTNKDDVINPNAGDSSDIDASIKDIPIKDILYGSAEALVDYSNKAIGSAAQSRIDFCKKKSLEDSASGKKHFLCPDI